MIVSALASAAAVSSVEAGWRARRCLKAVLKNGRSSAISREEMLVIFEVAKEIFASADRARILVSKVLRIDKSITQVMTTTYLKVKRVEHLQTGQNFGLSGLAQIFEKCPYAI